MKKHIATGSCECLISRTSWSSVVSKAVCNNDPFFPFLIVTRRIVILCGIIL